MSKPIHLENYDVFDELAAWAEKSPDHKRHAQVSTLRMPSGKIFFVARLTWVASTGSLYNLDRAEQTAQEATYLALMEFDRANASGDHGERRPG